MNDMNHNGAVNGNGHANGGGLDLVALLVESAVGRPVNSLALAQVGTMLRREANALVDLAAELERSANQVEVFAAKDQCRRWRAAERSRRYRARKALPTTPPSRWS